MPPALRPQVSRLRQAADNAPDASTPKPGRRLGSRRRDVSAAALVALLVAVMAQFPVLTNHYFYFWDDSAAEFLPVWHRMGSDLLAGQWHPLEPSMWNGGDFAAEALFGIWNPVVLLDSVITSAVGDLLVAAVIIKTQFLVILGLGVFALCREYGAKRSAAIAVAAALPFSGFTLYFDASSWIAGLMAFAWTSHFWWSTRRHLRGRLHPAVPIAFGLLTVTTGNPYGLLGMAVVVCALLVETVLREGRPAALRLITVSAISMSAAALVYLPLVLSARVTARDPNSGITNTGFLVPNLGDLLNLSSPAYLSHAVNWHLPFWSIPATYLTWFVAPLTPWLRWREVLGTVRSRISVAVVATVYLAATVGPSQLWLFRWPLRLIEYLFLAICVIFALALSAGPTRTNPKPRIAATTAIILIGGYLSWASRPDRTLTILAGTTLAAALTYLAVRTLRQNRRLLLVLLTGTAAVLAFQAVSFPANDNVTNWRAPHDVDAMRQHYGSQYHGNTLLVGDSYLETSRLGTHSAWHELPPGSVLQVAGITSLNNYTGVFHKPYMSAMCMSYYGATCPSLYKRLWLPVPDGPLTLADALKLQTVVVQTPASITPPKSKKPADNLAIPAGWTTRATDSYTQVLTRTAPLPWPNGRVSYTAPTVQVVADQTNPGGVNETVNYTGQGELRLAELLWPGWQATVDGKHVELSSSYAGLIRVNLPKSTPTGSTLRLSFRPPGFQLGRALALLGLAAALTYCLAWSVRSRRGRR